MSPLKHDPWRQLASGLYVPPLLHRYPGFPCGGCGCGCTSLPDEVEVIIANLQDDNCTDCTNFNDTFIAAFDAGRSDFRNCFWVHTFPSTECLYAELEVHFSALLPTFLAVSLQDGPGPPTDEFSLWVDSEISANCSDWSGEILPHSQDFSTAESPFVQCRGDLTPTCTATVSAV